MMDIYVFFVVVIDFLVFIYSNDNYDECSESVVQIGKKLRQFINNIEIKIYRICYYGEFCWYGNEIIKKINDC